MASLSITLAVCGMCSLICTPEALVAIGLNGPPVGAPGFKSQISIVLGPPPIHIRIAPLPDFFSSAAWAHIVSENDSAVPAIALAPARCCMKCRRVMPEGVAKLMVLLQGVMPCVLLEGSLGRKLSPGERRPDDTLAHPAMV